MTDPVETIRNRFDEAGLPFPSLPPAASRARLVSDWHLTTREGGPPPYRVEEHVAEFERGEAEDYVVLAHDGHGTDSWAISYLVVDGPVGVFVQSSWGGASTSPEAEEREIESMGERFRAVGELLGSSRGRLADGERLAVIESDFGDRGWVVLRNGESAAWQSSDAPLRAARAHLDGGPGSD